MNDTSIPTTEAALQERLEDFTQATFAGPMFRPHLGPSALWTDCVLSLWLTVRWASPSEHTGQKLRRFERGKYEETLTAGFLTGLGLEVTTLVEGNQISFYHPIGHVRGSIDGIVSGVPHGGDQPHLLEIKTASNTGHQALVKGGLEKTLPGYFRQIQAYMALSMTSDLSLSRALFVSINLAPEKTGQDWYFERVKYRSELGKHLLNAMETAVLNDSPPPRKSADPAYFECRMCNHWGTCHGKKLPPPTCRSCAKSTRKRDGTTFCEEQVKVLDLEAQARGCDAHLYHPFFVTPLHGPLTHANMQDIAYEDGAINRGNSKEWYGALWPPINRRVV